MTMRAFSVFSRSIKIGPTAWSYMSLTKSTEIDRTGDKIRVSSGGAMEVHIHMSESL